MAAFETVTALFTDLVGSTELRSRMGDDAADEVQNAHDAALRRAVADHHGREVKHTGDGIMAVFESSAEAVACSVAMQRAVVRVGRRLDVPLEIRVGVSAGDARNEDDDWFGMPVVEAARLCADATGGQILVSEVVRLLGGSRVALGYRAAGTRELKGLAEPTVAWEVVWEALENGVALPALFTRSSRARLVGRDAELETLRVAWNEVCQGKRRVVLIAGEPGVGKTRLAAELAREVHGQGATVVLGRCEDGFGAPYKPFAEALRAVVEGSELADLTEWASRYGADVARVVPVVRERFVDVGEPVAADPASEQLRLFEGVDALLTAGGLAAPMVMVLDDLHWSDTASLLLLRALARAGTRGGSLVLGTYRETELDRSHPLAQTLADLRRDGVAERVLLRGLDESGTAALIAAWAGDDVAAPFVSAVYRETEGNPFFIEEVLSHLTESGVIFRVDGRWTSDRPVDQLGIPEGVREAVGRRLARLPRATNDALAVAAVIGRAFDVELLAAVNDTDVDGAFAVLQPALDARLLAEDGEVLGRLTFSHALVRAALADELATFRRVRLHRRIGEAFERLHASTIESHLDELAHHFSEAAADGDAAKAIDYLQRSANSAMVQGAYDTAVARLGRAMELAEAASVPPRLWAEVVGDLGVLLSIGTDAAGARVLFTRSVERARTLDDPDVFARVVVRFSNLNEHGAPNLDLLTLVEEALAGLPDEEIAMRAGLEAMGAYLLAQSAPTAEEYKRAFERAEVAEQMTREGEAAQWRSLALQAGFFVRQSRPDAVGALAIADEMHQVPVFGRTRQMQIVAGVRGPGVAQNRQLIPLLQFGDRTAFDTGLERLRAESVTNLTPWHQVWRGQTEATLALLEGRLAEATSLCAAAAARIDPNTNFGMGARAQRQQILYELGRLQPGPLTETAERLPQFPALLTHAALLYAERDDALAARSILAPLADNDFAATPNDISQALFLREAAETVAHLCDVEWAAALHRRLAPYDGQLLLAYTPTSCEGSAARSLALLETVLGDLDAADRHFAAGLALEEGFRGRTLAARTRVWWAKMLITRDAPADRAHADELLSHARAECDELGLLNVRQLHDQT